MVASPAPGSIHADPAEIDMACADGLAEALEVRIAQMKRLVAALAPGSPAEALRALREAFPETSLAERVAALTGGDAESR